MLDVGAAEGLCRALGSGAEIGEQNTGTGVFSGLPSQIVLHQSFFPNQEASSLVLGLNARQAGNSYQVVLILSIPMAAYPT